MGKNSAQWGTWLSSFCPAGEPSLPQGRPAAPSFHGTRLKAGSMATFQTNSVLYTHSQYFVWLSIVLMLKERLRERKKRGGRCTKAVLSVWTKSLLLIDVGHSSNTLIKFQIEIFFFNFYFMALIHDKF